MGTNYQSAGNAVVLQTPPFNAADFTANAAMTWVVNSGNVGHFRFGIDGKLLTVSLKIGGTVGGVLSTSLLVRIPGGYISRNAVSTPVIVNSLGTGFQYGFADVTAGGTQLRFQLSQPAPFANWGAGAAEVDFLNAFEVQ